MNEKLLTHLKAYTYSIIILGDIADSAKCRITAESSQCLNQGKEFLGFKEKADTIGCLGGIAGNAEQESLHCDGMCLLIKSISTSP